MLMCRIGTRRSVFPFVMLWSGNFLRRLAHSAYIPAAILFEWELQNSGKLLSLLTINRRSHVLCPQMILNLSPLAAHLSESLTSLRFATKVTLGIWSEVYRILMRFSGQQHNHWHGKEADTVDTYEIRMKTVHGTTLCDTSVTATICMPAHLALAISFTILYTDTLQTYTT